MAEDNTRGEIKYLRGSGPPILSAEGETTTIDQIVYVVGAERYGQVDTPHSAQVIAIDLTRRTVRLQVLGGREILYCATGSDGGRNAAYWLFTTIERARICAVRKAEEAVQRAEKAADEAIKRLEDVKAKLADCEQWEPRNDKDFLPE